MDLVEYGRYVAALFFVLGLIAAAAWGARRFGLAPGQPTVRGEARRLQIVETLSLDPRRRLVLVRRDGRDVLILLGASGETVISAGDMAASPALQLAPAPGTQSREAA